MKEFFIFVSRLGFIHLMHCRDNCTCNLQVSLVFSLYLFRFQEERIAQLVEGGPGEIRKRETA